MLLTGKTVIVTGAGGGLGAGIAAVCSREGANVVVADIRGQTARAVADSLPGDALAVHCDVGDDEAQAELVQKAIAEFGRVDGLVNNAGINFAKPFLETTAEDWEHIIRVDLRAVFFLTQKVCRQMLTQSPGGSVVNIASVHAHAALPGAGPYDAAKAGVVMMGKSFALEMAPHNIRVNAISPGLLDTQIWQDLQDAAPSPEECLAYWRTNIPIGRVIAPEEIGELAAFLLSDRSASITGANIYADGGMTAQLISQEPYTSKPIEG